jgi:hypothetical protein
MRNISVLLIVGAVFAGCGKHDDNPPGETLHASSSSGSSGTASSGGPSSSSGTTIIIKPGSTTSSSGVDPRVVQYATSICDYYAKCLPEYLEPSFGDAFTCASYYERLELAALTLPGSALTEAALNACAARYDAGTCDEAAGRYAECAFKGTLADGKGCAIDAQCAGGVCAKVGQATCGTCAEFVQANGDCSADTSRCAVGLACHNNVCVTLQPKDASCAGGQGCAAGLVCSTGDTCQPVAQLNQPCPLGHECSITLTCDQGTKKCVAGPATTYAGVGQSCASGSCSASVCDTTSKTCVARLIVGASCAAAPTHCAIGSVCDTTSKTCVDDTAPTCN